MNHDADGHTAICRTGQFFRQRDLTEYAEAAAAPLFRIQHPEESELSHFAKQFARHVLVALPLLRVRHNAFLDESPHLLAHHLNFFGEVRMESHGTHVKELAISGGEGNCPMAATGTLPVTAGQLRERCPEGRLSLAVARHDLLLRGVLGSGFLRKLADHIAIAKDPVALAHEFGAVPLLHDRHA